MAKVIGNQKRFSAPVVEMDAGKFLHSINAGAQSQVTLFAERVQKLGEEFGRKWVLESLDSRSLIFRDEDQYFRADVQRLGKNRVRINNIASIRVTESKKEGLFQKNLGELIDAISEEDQSKADGCFNRLMAQRFRSSVIPENGIVQTRDGKLRFVKVANRIVSEKNTERIVKALFEALGATVKITRGRIVEAVYDEQPIKFPVSELTRRRVVARAMKSVAMEAYLSEGFQNRVRDVAGQVQKGGIADLEVAVKSLLPFLKEEQQFSLLTLNEMIHLIGDVLATQCCFNEHLAENVGKVFFRTSCITNRQDILESWKKTAKMAENASLLENVQKLETTKNFEGEYQDFLRGFFTEDMSTKTAKAGMYLVALKNMRKVLKDSKTDEDVVESLEQLITRLETSKEDVDDATLMEVEELVSSSSETLMQDVQSLSDYDEIPAPDETKQEPEMFGGDLGDKAGDEAGGPGLPLGDEEAAGGVAGLLAGESRNRAGGINEATKKCKKCGKGCKCVDGKCTCESGTCNECAGASMEEIKRTVSTLNAGELKLELKEWSENAPKFVAEDGLGFAARQLKAYIGRCEELEEAELYGAFNQILESIQNVETTEAEVIDSDPYSHPASGAKLDSNYRIEEDHITWKKGMKQSKVGGQIGGAETAKGDAMGHADEADPLVSKAGIPGAILKKGQKKISEGLLCPSCQKRSDPVDCMTESGPLCPYCGNQLDEQLLEALELSEAEKVKQDRVGSGAGLAKKDGKTSVTGGGTNQTMDQIGKGKGVASSSTGDIKTGSGKTDGLEGQEGKGVADEGGEMDLPTTEPSEDRQAATKGMRRLGLKKTKFNPKESKLNEMTSIMVTDQPVDQVVANIARSMDAGAGGPAPEFPGNDIDVDLEDGIEGEVEGDLEGELGGEGEGKLGAKLTGGLEGDLAGPEGDLAGPEGDRRPKGRDIEIEPEGEGSEEDETEEDETEEEEVDEVDEIEEGKLPDALRKYMKTKGGGKKGNRMEGINMNPNSSAQPQEPEAQITKFEYDPGDDRTYGSLVIQADTPHGKFVYSGKIGSGSEIEDLTITLNGKNLDLASQEGPDFGPAHNYAGAKARERFEKDDHASILTQWLSELPEEILHRAGVETDAETS